MHTHPVVTCVGELDGREVGDDVGCDVVRGVAHFVDDLLGDRGACDPATRAVVLGDHELAVAVRLDNRKAHAVQIGHRPPVDQAIATGALGATLVDVARHHPSRHPIVVVGRPSELVHHRCIRERRVGRPPCYDDIRALHESPQDRRGPDVGVRALHPVPNGRQRLVRVHVPQLVSLGQQRIETVHEIVARDHAYRGSTLHSGGPPRLDDSLGAPARVHTPCVGDDADALLDDCREEPLHERNEVAREARTGVSGALLLHDRHGDLGEVIEHQVVDGSLLDLANRSLEVVAPEPLAAGDSYDFTLSHGQVA